jgi:hypothetical protein
MNLNKLRRWSVVAVVANVGVALLAAAVLPAQALGLLPVLALTLPLLTTGVLDAAASGCSIQH